MARAIVNFWRFSRAERRALSDAAYAKTVTYTWEVATSKIRGSAKTRVALILSSMGPTTRSDPATGIENYHRCHERGRLSCELCPGPRGRRCERNASPGENFERDIRLPGSDPESGSEGLLTAVSNFTSGAPDV
jgi:hypothetical protein